MPFLANIECCLKFLEYPLLVLSIKMFEFYFQNHFLKYLNKFAVETGKKSSSKLAKSKPSNQSKICSKFQRCILAEKKNSKNWKKNSIIDVRLGPEYPHLWSWWWRHQNNIDHVVLVLLLLAFNRFFTLVFMHIQHIS